MDKWLTITAGVWVIVSIAAAAGIIMVGLATISIYQSYQKTRSKRDVVIDICTVLAVLILSINTCIDCWNYWVYK
jgi:hypothetical protein